MTITEGAPFPSVNYIVMSYARFDQCSTDKWIRNILLMLTYALKFAEIIISATYRVA